MKQIFIFIIVLLFSNQYAICQKTFGIKAGLNLSNQVKTFNMPQNPTDQTQDTKPLVGYQLGAFYKVNLNPKWTISTEMNFSLNGSRTQYLTERQVLNPDGVTHYYNDKIGYIEIPLSLQYNINNFYLGVGPSIAFKVFSKITNFENKSFNTSYYKTVDATGNFIAGYKISKKLDINFRYSFGFLNIYENTNYFSTKNRFVNLSMLYSLKK